MGLNRIALLLLLLAMALAMVAQSSATSMHGGVEFGLTWGRVGDFIDPNEEMMMESESSRRSLRRRQRSYISYGALRKNNVPCNKRGRSYYNCQKSGRANPYRRGCTVATRCARR